MAQQAENKENEKEQMAAKLLYQLYQQSPLVFRNRTQNMLSKYREEIMKWGDNNDDNDNQITQEQFVSYLDGKMSSILAKVVFGMIYSAKDDNKKEEDKKNNAIKKISRVDVVKFAQGYKSRKHVRAVTVKDANWVLSTIKKTDFAQIDKNEDFKIDIDEFKNYFKPMGLSNDRIKTIFKVIDKDNDGIISLIEYNKWRSKQKALDLQSTLNQ